MPDMLTYIILYFTSIIASVSVAKMFFILIAPGELLQGWNKVLMKIEPIEGQRNFLFREIIYKRIGGCMICTRDQFAWLGFAVLCILTYYSPAENPASYIPYEWLKWIVYAVMFFAHNAIVLTLGQMIEYEKRGADSLKDIKEQMPDIGEPIKVKKRGL